MATPGWAIDLPSFSLVLVRVLAGLYRRTETERDVSGVSAHCSAIGRPRLRVHASGAIVTPNEQQTTVIDAAPSRLRLGLELGSWGERHAAEMGLPDRRPGADPGRIVA